MDLYNTEITLIDIAINVKDPNSYLNMLSLIANNNDLTIIDHHETNLKYLSLIPKNIRFLQFPTATAMAKAIEQMFNAEKGLLLLGVITDRDSSIRELIDIGSREFEILYNYANVYDYLIRQNLAEAVRGVYQDGIDYIIRQSNNVQYPPAQIADQLMSSIRRYDNIVYVEFTPAQNTSMWIWKIYDEILRRTGADYLVSPAKVLDRQLNTMVDVVFVVKYWLSTAPSPKPLLSSVISGRKVIGHDDGFSISANSVDDARALAQNIINTLQSNFSSSVSLIPSSHVANAIRSDFSKILLKLEEILRTQTEMYKEYLELKKRQVQLLERVEDNARRRAD